MRTRFALAPGLSGGSEPARALPSSRTEPHILLSITSKQNVVCHENHPYGPARARSTRRACAGLCTASSAVIPASAAGEPAAAATRAVRSVGTGTSAPAGAPISIAQAGGGSADGARASGGAFDAARRALTGRLAAGIGFSGNTGIEALAKPQVRVNVSSPSFSIEVTTLSPGLSQTCLSLG